tara:strand:+ start:380 stop:616 length:237 start_codon:yes stop_codon:yes gene_type:complete
MKDIHKGIENIKTNMVNDDLHAREKKKEDQQAKNRAKVAKHRALQKAKGIPRLRETRKLPKQGLLIIRHSRPIFITFD